MVTLVEKDGDFVKKGGSFAVRARRRGVRHVMTQLTQCLSPSYKHLPEAQRVRHHAWPA